jgi:hypothetical protein
MERWTRPVFRTDLEFKTCYYTNDENLRHADPGWDAYFADYIANDPGIQHCFEHADDDDAYYSGPPQIVSRDLKGPRDLPQPISNVYGRWRHGS